MSKIIASAAIRGAHKIVGQADKKWQEAMDKWGANEPVGFPNTAYYLPVIYGILGTKVEKLGDMEGILKKCKLILPPPVRETCPLPYLAPALDAGMVTFFAEELIEAIRYLEEPDFYTNQEDPTDNNIWLGAADDVILRKRGVEFVDGTAPGFAAVLGAAPTSEIAASIAQELQQKNLYVFMSAEYNGKRFAEQLLEAGVQIGWPTRLVSFGPDITATVFAAGFAIRAGFSFGGIEPGDFRKHLIYNKDRIFAFALPLGSVTDEWYANAAGAINFGFPTIADTPIPEILPTGICTYEHVVSNIPHDNIVAKAIEVRGLKVTVAEVPIPVAFGPAFEGERVRGEDIYLECGGGKTQMVEWVTSKRMEEGAVYTARDVRIEGMTDETTDIYYSCTLCQSFAPSHVCVISPERTGLCGSYNWMDCKAAYEINPTGPNQPVEKGEIIDTRFGQWKGVNEFITKASRGKIDHYNFYSIMIDPMTTCGCCECIASVLPLCNGIMTVNREYAGQTPCGMKFTTLAGTIGGGVSTPGFVGHGKYNICQRKFILGDGGIKRIVWMPKMLKEEIAERLKARAIEVGVPDLPDMIADETVGTTEEEILSFLEEKGHPAISMEPII